MKILAFDTTTSELSIAILEDEKILAERNISAGLNHSSYFFPQLEKLLKKIKARPQDISLLAVSNGPGSFTGIRVGLTVAKTLAQCWEIPLISFSSLDVLAFQQDWSGLVCPLIDALRNEVYTALYRGEERLTDYYLGNLENFVQKNFSLFQNASVLFTGPAAKASFPKAAFLGILAYRHYRAEKPSKDSYKKVFPLYIRRPFAEEKYHRCAQMKAPTD